MSRLPGRFALIRLVGSAIRQTWLKVAAGR
jgi:hypothetical protein